MSSYSYQKHLPQIGVRDGETRYDVFVKLRRSRRLIGRVEGKRGEWVATLTYPYSGRRVPGLHNTRDIAAMAIQDARSKQLKAQRKRERAAAERCRCRPPRRHINCFYCGTGLSDSVCGVCAEAGIDGKVIRGTSRVVCSNCRETP